MSSNEIIRSGISPEGKAFISFIVMYFFYLVILLAIDLDFFKNFNRAKFGELISAINNRSSEPKSVNSTKFAKSFSFAPDQEDAEFKKK